MARPKKYTINEEYFNEINSQNKAYILGFLYADGHVGLRSFEFCIQARDIEIIKFIKSEMNLGHPIKIKTIKGRKYVSLSISNKRTVNTLRARYNIPTNKSRNNLVLPNLAKEFIPHFLRGLFDGDGSAWCSTTKTGHTEFAISFSGGEKFLKEVQSILREKDINSSLRYRYGKDNKNSCSIESKGSVKLISFYDYIYSDANFFLKRKHNKLLRAKGAGIKYKNGLLDFNGIGEKILVLYSDGMKQKDIHLELEVPYPTVRSFIGRKRRAGIIL